MAGLYDPTQEEIRRAGAHLQSLLDAMWAGHQVRSPLEFRADLQALQVAVTVLRHWYSDKAPPLPPLPDAQP